MASALLGLFPNASSITTVGGRCSRRKQSAKNQYASSIIRKTEWNRTREIQNECSSIVRTRRHNLNHHYYKGTSNEFQRKFVLNAISTQSNEFESQTNKSSLDSLKDIVGVLYKFTRPYSLVVLFSAIPSTSLLTVEKLSDLSPAFFLGMLQYLAPVMFMMLYHNAVNQLADIEIDKINKPYLPLASGELSFKAGVIIAALCATMSLGLGLIAGSKPLLWTLIASFLLGSGYSINLPLLRWKRSTLLTMIYATYPIIVMNIGPFIHQQTHVLKRTMTFTRPFFFSVMMSMFFSLVIPLAKDLPDIEGDKAQGVKTLAVLIGPKRVFWISFTILEMAYVTAILVGATSPILWSKIFTVLSHAILASIAWNQAKNTDLKNKHSLHSYYLFIFKLLTAEHFITPLVR